MVKGKVSSRTGHEGPEGEVMYTSTLSLTSALEWLGYQVTPGRITIGKAWVPIV
jgi:hypothetical protein